MKQIFTFLFLSFFAIKMNAQSITSSTCPGSCGPGTCDVVFSGLNPFGGTLEVRDASSNFLGTINYSAMGLASCVPAGATSFYEGSNTYYALDPITGSLIQILTDPFTGLPMTDPFGNYLTTIIDPITGTFFTLPPSTIVFPIFTPNIFPSIVIANPLPVKITSFTITQEGNSNKLTWQTALEINSDKFDIEKSTDGIHFATIGTVKAAGNSSTTKTYTHNDNSIHVGTEYYRLNQKDVDGKSTLSEVISITNVETNNIVLTTNPVKAGEKITILSKTPYKIYNMMGAEVKEINIVAAGTYIIKNKAGYTQKLIVQ